VREKPLLCGKAANFADFFIGRKKILEYKALI
jgi:hypothetical protein